MDEALLQGLIDFIKEANPEVWAAARRQVEVAIIQGGIFILLLLGGVIYCINKRRTVDDETKTFLAVIAAIFAVAGIVGAVMILGYILNPEYQAIRFLSPVALCE